MKNLEEIRNEIVDLKDLMATYGIKFNLIESNKDYRFVIESEKESNPFDSFIVAYKDRNNKNNIQLLCFIVAKELNGLKSQTIYQSDWDSAKSEESLKNHIIAFCNQYQLLYNQATKNNF